jgi:hypothetical protein
MRSLYDTLGLGPQATDEAIRQAYRRIAKERHPDTSAGSEAAMRLLNEAYHTLRDPDRRRAYDLTLRNPEKRPSRQPPPVPLDPETFRTKVFQPLDRQVVATMRDLHEALSELAEDPTDEDAVTAFDLVVVDSEATLTKAANLLASVTWPPSLAPGLTRYQDGLRQADAAVSLLGSYSLDFDETLLQDGETLLQRAAGQLADGRRR